MKSNEIKKGMTVRNYNNNAVGRVLSLEEYPLTGQKYVKVSVAVPSHIGSASIELREWSIASIGI